MKFTAQRPGPRQSRLPDASELYAAAMPLAAVRRVARKLLSRPFELDQALSCRVALLAATTSLWLSFFRGYCFRKYENRAPLFVMGHSTDMVRIDAISHANRRRR